MDIDRVTHRKETSHYSEVGEGSGVGELVSGIVNLKGGIARVLFQKQTPLISE